MLHPCMQQSPLNVLELQSPENVLGAVPLLDRQEIAFRSTLSQSVSAHARACEFAYQRYMYEARHWKLAEERHQQIRVEDRVGCHA